MKCVNPQRIKVHYVDTSAAAVAERTAKGKNPHTFEGFVPCGKCYACLAYRRRQWQFRLKQEAANSAKTFFVTLTRNDAYNDKMRNELDKNELKYLFKVLRLNGLKFKYFAIGEYGTRADCGHRAHYHILFFFKEWSETRYEYFAEQLYKHYSEKHNINGVWNYEPKGFIKIDVAIPAQIGYITHYHVRPKIPKGCKSVTPGFQIQSQGIGMEGMEERVNFLRNSRDLVIRDLEGNVYRLPRYYRKKFVIEHENNLSEYWQQYFKSYNEYQAYKRLSTKDKLMYRIRKREADKQKLENYNKQVKINTI